MATQEELDRIIEETISYSDGSFYMSWGDGYEELTKEEQDKVAKEVYQEIHNCDGCGWHFHVDNLEQYIASGDCLCWHCANDREEENEG
jgi:hypothetical protein